MYPNLKLQLWRAGIRQNRLAQMLGIDQTLLSKIVNGFRTPDEAMRAKIANLLHSDEHWLFEDSPAVARAAEPLEPEHRQ